MVWIPQPNLPSLKCRVCGLVKKQVDKDDDIIVSKDGSYAAGTWFCPNGHANKI